MTATHVYVIRSADDTLYVGHTQNLFGRLKQHARAHWAPRVVGVRAEVFRCKEDALGWEKHLIADLDVQGNPRFMSWERFLNWAGIEAAA